ncbi:peptidylprolyl isomerase [Desertibaculum subflavum]|uniref:peptidylprolyl isomerase n=1 Tax=Desertibaculum subflavum TaxID=2268458 RepID=UPI0013C5378D
MRFRSSPLSTLCALALALAAVLPVFGSAAAQDILRIAAIVNDEVISAQDLDQRLDLAIAATGQPNNPELRRRLRDQVLRNLIDERLQMQEAGRMKIAATPEELDQAIRQLERQNNIPEGKFEEVVTRQGASIQALNQQLRAEIAWSKVIRRRVLPSIVITDEEVDLAIQQLKRDVGGTESLLAEILLLVDNPDQEEEARRNAVNIIEQLRSGAAFPAMARQFSNGSTATAGGDLGWVRAGTLPEEVERVVAKLSPGQISEPIRSTTGFHIVLVRERRQIRLGNPADATVAMKQITFPITPNTSRAEADATLSVARAVFDSVTGCDDLTRVARELQLKGGATDIPRQKVGDMPPRVRPIAADLEIGKLSPPVPSESGLSMYMVCERKETSQEPDRDRMRERLASARIEQGARRLLRDLRRDSVVEFR